MQLASRMEAALGEHKRELAAKGHEAAELRNRMEALSAENVELAAVVSELEGKVSRQGILTTLHPYHPTSLPLI